MGSPLMSKNKIHSQLFPLQWSFGVTCWEVFSAGKIPYPGVDPSSLAKMLVQGDRLEKPLNSACTDEMLVHNGPFTITSFWGGDK